MNGKRLFIVYFVCCLVIFGIGIIRLNSSFVSQTTVTCATAFNGQCTRPGQCSYTETHGTKNCVITCETKVSVNGTEKIITSKGECGTWATTAPETPVSGGGTLDGGDDDGWQHEQPINAAGNPMFSSMDKESASTTGSTQTKKK